MSEEKKMNFFERVITSIKDFEKYIIFAAEKTKTAFAYLAIVIGIFSIIIAGVFTYKFGISMQRGINYLNSNINQISYSNDNLSINSRRGN